MVNMLQKMSYLVQNMVPFRIKTLYLQKVF
jgi:hypothetical protein